MNQTRIAKTQTRDRYNHAAPRRAVTSRRTPRTSGNRDPMLYVYGVIRRVEPVELGFSEIGDGSNRVSLVRHRDLAAVVSETPSAAIETNRQNVLAHEAVVERLLERGAIIPMSFGNVFRARVDVVALLRSGYATFSDALRAVEGKVEFGLRVSWNLEAEARRLAKRCGKSTETKRLGFVATDASLAGRIAYGEALERALQNKALSYSEKILDTLRASCLSVRVSEHEDERVVLHAAFLVERDRQSEFEQRARVIGTQYKALGFRLTGPWPPYSFVSIHLSINGGGGEA